MIVADCSLNALLEIERNTKKFPATLGLAADVSRSNLQMLLKIEVTKEILIEQREKVH